MADFYRTIAQTGHGYYEEKKSKFYGEAVNVTSREAAEAVLDRIRKESYDARHHCYACVIGADREQKRSSDDGEPSGTAGAPILKVLDQSGCTNVLLVVTRYFGGTLLGTGGLVRAYTSAAAAALQDAGIVSMRAGVSLHVVLPYSLYDKVSYLLEQQGLEVKNPGFGAAVSFDLTVPAEQKDGILEQLRAAGSGQIRTEEGERGYYPFPETRRRD